MCKLCMLSEWPTILNIFLLLPYTIITVKKNFEQNKRFFVKKWRFFTTEIVKYRRLGKKLKIVNYSN